MPLVLANSSSPCTPLWGRKPGPAKNGVFAVSSLGGTCVYCGISAPCGMEHHTDEKTGRKVTVCPYCHGCLHLQEVSYVRAGTLIWAPSITQEALNLFCAGHFIFRTFDREQAQQYQSLVKASEMTFEHLNKDLRASLKTYLTGEAFPLKKVSSCSLDPLDPLVLAKALNDGEAGSTGVDGIRVIYTLRAFIGLSRTARWRQAFLGQPALAQCLSECAAVSSDVVHEL